VLGVVFVGSAVVGYHELVDGGAATVAALAAWWLAAVALSPVLRRSGAEIDRTGTSR